jgi:drug/metabolite transporter (DMT)-like permease
MHSSLVIAVVAGFGGMLGWGLADFFAKKTIDRIGDLQTLFWSQCIGILPVLVIFLFHPSIPSLTHVNYLELIIFGAVSGLSYLPLYNGFGKGQVSILSPVFASYSVLLALLSAIFLHESISAGHWIAIAVVFIGILCVSTDLRELKCTLRVRARVAKGVPEVLSAMIVYTFWLFFLDKFLQARDWVFPLLIIRIFSTLTLLLYSRIRSLLLGVGDKTLWKYLCLIGFTDIAAFSFVSYGFSRSVHTSIIAILSATFSVPTIILAAIFLKERIQRLQAVAVGVILLGVILIFVA